MKVGRHQLSSTLMNSFSFYISSEITIGFAGQRRRRRRKYIGLPFIPYPLLTSSPCGRVQLSLATGHWKISLHTETSGVYFKTWQAGGCWACMGTGKMLLLGMELFVYQQKKKSEACLEGHDPHVLLDVAGGTCPQSGTLRTWLCQSPGPLLKSPNSFPASRQVILMFTPTSFYPSHTQFLFPGPFIPPPRSDSFNYPSYFLQLPFPPSVQICFPLRTKHWPMVNRNDRIF